MVTPARQMQQIRWLAPSPLWGDRASWVRVPNQALKEQPVILRFANDSFMDEMMAMLQQAPWRLSEWIARPETWRKPMKSPAPILKSRAERNVVGMYNKTKLVMQQQSVGRQKAMQSLPVIASKLAYDQSLNNHDPIKLYQASHQRYYLVSASLTANQSRYPDHLLNLSNNESASFVVRAVARRTTKKIAKNEKTLNSSDLSAKQSRSLARAEQWYEYALVTTEFGLVWKELGLYQPESPALQQLVPGEEKQPLFPVTYQNHCDQNRQILAGTIPVSQRETWLAAPGAGNLDHSHVANAVLSHEGGITHLKELFQADVSEPWKALIEQAQSFKTSIHADENTFPSSPFSWNPIKAAADEARALKTARDQLQTGSWYVLLNFANFLEEFLPEIWQFLKGEKTSAQLNSAQHRKFAKTIQQTEMSTDWYARLARENLAIAEYLTDRSIWDKLEEFYEMERYFNLDSWSSDRQELLRRARQHRRTREDRVKYRELRTLLDPLKEQQWNWISELLQYIERKAPNLEVIKDYVRGNINPSEFFRSSSARHFYDSIENIEVDSALIETIGVSEVTDHRVSLITSLQDALVQAKKYEVGLEAVDVAYDRQALHADDERSVPVDSRWPHFLFPLADPDASLSLEGSAIVPAFQDNAIDGMTGFDKLAAMLDKMADDLDSLLPKDELAAQATGQFNQRPLLDPSSTRFVVRCIYEKPNCGPIYPPVVSKASCQLEFAPFFDPDAPARPIRIPMPLDISPAGLRKYKKNTMFLISDMFCGKMKRMRKYTLADLVLSVLPWPFHKDLPEAGPTGPCRGPSDTFGMFCSLSIPIVTLCAMILLMIMVRLFDIFFRWIPYLIVCLPIPGFKGKD